MMVRNDEGVERGWAREDCYDCCIPVWSRSIYSYSSHTLRRCDPDSCIPAFLITSLREKALPLFSFLMVAVCFSLEIDGYWFYSRIKLPVFFLLLHPSTPGAYVLFVLVFVEVYWLSVGFRVALFSAHLRVFIFGVWMNHELVDLVFATEISGIRSWETGKDEMHRLTCALPASFIIFTLHTSSPDGSYDNPSPFSSVNSFD